MKNAKLHEIITCVLFCGFIGIMGLCMVLLPKSDFSETEKRELSQFPALTWETLSSGDFADDLETYMADHLPGRTFFVGLKAYFDLLTGQQSSKDIYVAEGDRLVEKPVIWDQAQVEKNMKYINKFSAALDVPVDLLIVPSAGFLLEDTVVGIHDAYTDDAILQAIYSQAGEKLNTFDLLSVYQQMDADRLYYRTDHHWTSYGAYQAYSAYMQSIGMDYPAVDFFTVERHSGFRGSTYTRSALWLTPAEDIELWVGSALQVENSTTEGIHQGAFYPQRLEEADMYTVFLDGNQPLVHIYNEANAGKGTILVVRDSYSNCLGPFLAESYEEVILVDLRYYRKSVSELVATEGVDRVLVLYCIGNFMTDNNMLFLR